MDEATNKDFKDINVADLSVMTSFMRRGLKSPNMSVRRFYENYNDLITRFEDMITSTTGINFRKLNANWHDYKNVKSLMDNALGHAEVKRRGYIGLGVLEKSAQSEVARLMQEKTNPVVVAKEIMESPTISLLNPFKAFTQLNQLMTKLGRDPQYRKGLLGFAPHMQRWVEVLAMAEGANVRKRLRLSDVTTDLANRHAPLLESLKLGDYDFDKELKARINKVTEEQKRMQDNLYTLKAEKGVIDKEKYELELEKRTAQEKRTIAEKKLAGLRGEKRESDIIDAKFRKKAHRHSRDNKFIEKLTGLHFFSKTLGNLLDIHTGAVAAQAVSSKAGQFLRAIFDWKTVGRLHYEQLDSISKANTEQKLIYFEDDLLKLADKRLRYLTNNGDLDLSQYEVLSEIMKKVFTREVTQKFHHQDPYIDDNDTGAIKPDKYSLENYKSYDL